MNYSNNPLFHSYYYAECCDWHLTAEHCRTAVRRDYCERMFWLNAAMMTSL